ncbi:lysozyme inhibitor LprI family protein [Paenirhodobacter enshiensis]|uniref:lysozyme inhibitor LprI family protein n=1 Tax=Paenirhodobacter enshiensis TaxID=1105367 RepID=UPI0009DCD05E|nr:lysozyme inhibitor LprI family protein [Paenirhodobacter enshiensis]
MRRIFILSVFWIAVAAHAEAQSTPDRIKPYLGTDTVVVWKDAESEDRGMAIIDSGANQTNPLLLAPLAACVVPAETAIVIVKLPSLFQSPTFVEVIEGPFSGCFGTIPIEAIQFPDHAGATSSSAPSPVDHNTSPPSRPSFDCKSAKAPDEIAVCQSPDLADLDRTMAAAYQNARQKHPESLKDLKLSQAEWRKQRSKCGGDASCLHRVYQKRIADLPSEGTTMARAQPTPTSPKDEVTASDECIGRVINDIGNDLGYPVKKGELIHMLHDYEGTPEGHPLTYAVHGGGIYPADHIQLINCSIRPIKTIPYYRLVLNDTPENANDIIAQRARSALSSMMMNSADAGNAADAYVNRPDSACGKLAARAIAGDASAAELIVQSRVCQPQ